MGKAIYYGLGFGLPTIFILLSLWMAWSNMKFYGGSRAVEAEVTDVETRTEERSRRVTRTSGDGGSYTQTEYYTATIYTTSVIYPFGDGGNRRGEIELEDYPVAEGDRLAVRYALDDPDDIRLDTGTTGIWAGPLFLGIFFGLLPLGAVIFIGSKMRGHM
ncbi:MAG: DUF3592 domain-containing protein [Pseudomonadota bacterium]